MTEPEPSATYRCPVGSCAWTWDLVLPDLTPNPLILDDDQRLAEAIVRASEQAGDLVTAALDEHGQDAHNPDTWAAACHAMAVDLAAEQAEDAHPIDDNAPAA